MAGNREQRDYWNEQAGPVWVAHQERLDEQIGVYGEIVLERLAPGRGERVLDVGCGCGATTLSLAERVGAEGSVVGVDVSAPMLARARERAREGGRGNVAFLEADAQTAALPGPFDVAFSRFGVMFFEDPGHAFRNLASALHPGGRLGFVCWQAASENPWVTVPMAAAAAFLEPPPPPPPEAPGMFQLADPVRLRGLLGGAGWSDVSVEDVHLDVALGGGDLDQAVRFFLEVGPLGSLLREQDPEGHRRGEVAAALREVLAAHDHGGGPVLGSAVWLVSARASGSG